MKLFKRFQAIVALVTLFVFFGLVTLSAFPTSEMSTGAMEEVGQPKAKKSPMVWIIIGVAVVGTAAVILSMIYPSPYDPRGDWDFKWRDTPSGEWTTQSLSFSGKRTNGTVEYPDGGMTGTYTLDGKKLNFQLLYTVDNPVIYVGEFQSKNSIIGTYTQPSSSWIDGQFEMTRR